MYSRQLLPPPEHIIQDGKANFGTYLGVSPKIDIRGMKAPYAGIPVPSFLSNIRIKSRLVYVFSLDNYIGITEFFDFKVFGLAEITLWNKEKNTKSAYHTFMSTRKRFVPTTTDKGICVSYRKSRYIKISWGKEHKHHSMTFNIQGDSARPDAKGFFISQTKDDFHNDVMFVNPSPTSSRCSATWISTMTINGNITVTKRKNPVQEEKTTNSTAPDGLGLMTLNRTYYKVHSKSKIAYGIGISNDKKITFQLQTSNLDAANPDNYNNNILFVDGEPTILPSVYMTHPFGIEKKWILQDTESMIDLSFTPISCSYRTLNIIALRTSYMDIYGTYDGVLLTKDGEKIVLKNFPGILYKNMLRM